MQDNVQYTDVEIFKIAKHQKAIILLISVNLLCMCGGVIIFSIFGQANPLLFRSINSITSIIFFATAIIGIVFIYRFAKALRSSTAWLYIILMFIPIIGLIALLILNRKATKVLRQQNIRVSLMGVSSEDLSKLSSRAT